LSTDAIEQLLQIAGAVLILAAYVAGLLGRLNPWSWTYLGLNLGGSSLLAVLAFLGGDCGRW
jgi:hypothetical protein